MTAGQRPRARRGALVSAATRMGPATGLIVLLGLLVLVFSLISDSFFTVDNMWNVLRVSAIPLILAVGMTFVVLTAGADLSVAAAMALVGIAVGKMLTSGLDPILVVLLAVLFGGLLGLFNGFLVGVVGMSFFVVTLGTLSGFRGLALVWTNGESIQVYDYDLIIELGDGSVGIFPIPVLIAAAVFLVGVFLLHYTAWGRSVYAVGSSREAARLAGIRVSLVEMSVYVTTGLLAGLAAVMQAGRLTTASPVVGSGLELQVIAAVLLGGTLLSGGAGGLLGTLIGVLLIEVIKNGLSIAGVATFWQGVITGAILIVAVYLDKVQRSRAGAGAKRLRARRNVR